MTYSPNSHAFCSEHGLRGSFQPETGRLEGEFCDRGRVCRFHGLVGERQVVLAVRGEIHRLALCVEDDGTYRMYGLDRVFRDETRGVAAVAQKAGVSH